MQTIFTSMKVNNEIELCEIYDLDLKAAIERALLQERISYFLKWPKLSIFSRRKNTCILCVNESVVELTEEIIDMLCNETGFQVKYLMRRSSYDYPDV